MEARIEVLVGGRGGWEAVIDNRFYQGKVNRYGTVDVNVQLAEQLAAKIDTGDSVPMHHPWAQPHNRLGGGYVYVFDLAEENGHAVLQYVSDKQLQEEARRRDLAGMTLPTKEEVEAATAKLRAAGFTVEG